MGLDKVWIACDVGTKWVEDKQALALEPFEMDIENVGRLSAKVSLTNPNRLPAVLDMGRLAAAFQAMEIGPVAVKVRDSGLVKLFKANLERQAAAGGVAANPFADAKQRMMAAPVMNVGGITLADAASRFTETSGQTMTITLTPKAAVSIAQLTAPGATAGPDAAALLLDQFTVEAAIAP